MLGDRTVDAVLNFEDDLGADPSGRSTSDGSLEALNTLRGSIRVIVPEGRYRFSDTTHEVTSPSSSGLRIFEPEEHTTPVFESPEHYSGPWLQFETDGAFRGINIDRSAQYCSPEVHIDVADRFEIANVEVLGREVRWRDGGGVFSLTGRNDSTTITAANVRIPEGTTTPSINGDQPGFRVPEANKGTVTIRNCRAEECSSHGVEACFSRGPVTIEGGYFRNNNHSQVCFAGPESRVEDITAVVDLSVSSIETEEYGRIVGVLNEARTSRANFQPTGGGSLLRSTIYVGPGDAQRIPAGYYASPLGGGMSIRGCDIVIDQNEVPAIRAEEPEPLLEEQPPIGSPAIQMIRVACRGQAFTGESIVVKGRPGTELRRSCIALPSRRESYDLPPGSQVSRVNTQGGCTGPPN